MIDGGLHATGAEAPTFSVLIAAYQAAHSVAWAVQSALDQTLPPVDVIVCDDGSTDDLYGALSYFGGSITLVRQEHAGAAAARNRAAREANGDFLVILDADDVFLPRRLEGLARLARIDPELDILTTDEFLERNGRILDRKYRSTGRFATENQRETILERDFIAHAAVRTSRFWEHGGFDESLLVAEDWDLWIRMLLAGSRAGLVEEPLMHYRQSEHSLTSDPIRFLRGRIRVIDRVLARPDLSANELEVAAVTRERFDRELNLSEARLAIIQRSGDARQRVIELALDPRQRPSSRLKAAICAVSPGLARYAVVHGRL